VALSARASPIAFPKEFGRSGCPSNIGTVHPANRAAFCSKRWRDSFVPSLGHTKSVMIFLASSSSSWSWTILIARLSMRFIRMENKWMLATAGAALLVYSESSARRASALLLCTNGSSVYV